ncbi:hypothetical protein ACFYYP_32910 [Microbispora rosea]|uniref:hypothetical protein n=1 Tax=Microbispora rosea TaxID=58117 RepID=UPI0036A0991C
MAAERNPLHDDPALFEMYMSALDQVLSQPEIKRALDDFDLSASTIRLMLVADAARVLNLAPREFAAYRSQLAQRATGASDQADELGALAQIGRVFAAAGGVLIVAGFTARWLWDQSWIMLWPGATSLMASAVTFWLLRMRTSYFGTRVLQGELIPGMNPALVFSRDRLITALSQVELLAQVRTLVNTMRARRYNAAFSVTSSPGLSEVYDSVYNVPTRTLLEIEGLIRGLSGASLGVAGPRGSGKSTIVRQYCGPVRPDSRFVSFNDGWERIRLSHLAEDSGGDLRCMVSAPVDYAARDFVLHLFATFCRSVIVNLTPRGGRTEAAVIRRLYWARRIWWTIQALVGHSVTYGIVIVVLLWYKEPIARALGMPEGWVVGVAVAAGLFGLLRFAHWLSRSIAWWRRGIDSRESAGIVTAARRHLLRVRFLQSRNLGWTGGLKLAVGLEGQKSVTTTHAEQPLSYPEVVEQFRTFARRVAAFVHARGDNVFLGVDELDKIGSADQAERFLNEIKGIFGVPHIYFLISVSDDALMAFERRGIPLRDAFDSSFDEIVRVGLLDYAESRRLLYRRVIGLSEPYVGLCHAMSGGLARDLIRSARQLVRVGASLAAAADADETDDIIEGMEANRFLLATEGRTSQEGGGARPGLPELCAALVREELARKARASAHALQNVGGSHGRVHQALYDIGYADAASKPPMKIVDAVVKGDLDEPFEVRRLRQDFAAYAYFCATLQEIFGEFLDEARTARCADDSTWPGSFDALASARHAFSMDARIAWNAVTGCRAAWNLNVRDLQ